MISLVDLFAIGSIPGIGDQTLRKVIKSNLTIEEIVKLNNTSLTDLFRNEKSVENFREYFQVAREDSENKIASIESQGIKIIHYFSQQYPLLLRLLNDYPVFLFCKGNIDLLSSTRNIAIIGTRESSEIGNKIARSTAKYFSSNGYTIVSGLALGIDTVGHQAALDTMGNTIAVLTDINKIYPKENFHLANQILKQDGLLISENKPNSFQGKSAFVLRDRIQSGLSLAVFPIETDVKGGTMHTVGYAQDQGRLLFVPNVHNPQIRNQYETTVTPSFKKIEGIKHLIATGKAIPYIKDDYHKIENKILELELNLINKHAQLDTRNFFSKTYSFITSKITEKNRGLENSSIDKHQDSNVTDKDTRVTEVKIDHSNNILVDDKILDKIIEEVEKNERVKCDERVLIENSNDKNINIDETKDKLALIQSLISESLAKESILEEKLKENLIEINHLKLLVKELIDNRKGIEKMYKDLTKDKKITRKKDPSAKKTVNKSDALLFKPD